MQSPYLKYYLDSSCGLLMSWNITPFLGECKKYSINVHKSVLTSAETDHYYHKLQMLVLMKGIAI